MLTRCFRLVLLSQFFILGPCFADDPPDGHTLQLDVSPETVSLTTDDDKDDTGQAEVDLIATLSTQTPDMTVQFSVNGSGVGQTTTNSDGVATLPYHPSAPGEFEIEADGWGWGTDTASLTVTSCTRYHEDSIRFVPLHGAACGYIEHHIYEDDECIPPFADNRHFYTGGTWGRYHVFRSYYYRPSGSESDCPSPPEEEDRGPVAELPSFCNGAEFTHSDIICVPRPPGWA